ncbi:MAG: LysR family transcriptional regulator, partial [Planctomycetota bacterium]
MHLKSLKIFCDTVALRSFSKAADENGVSQSNASHAVHQLEERLGIELIDRSTRPFQVTAAGEKYYEGSRAILREYDDLEQDVRSLHHAAAARLSIGAIYSVGLAD